MEGAIMAAIAMSYFMMIGLGFGARVLWVKLRLIGTGDLYLVNSETYAGTKHIVPITKGDTVTVLGKPRKLTAGGRVWLSGRQTWWQDEETGACLRPPPMAKVRSANKVLQFLWIDNPSTLAHAVATNDARDALLANSEKDPWVKALILPLLIVAILTLGVVSFLAYHFLNSGVVKGA